MTIRRRRTSGSGPETGRGDTCEAPSHTRVADMTKDEAAVERLIEMGYLKYVPAPEIPDVRKELVKRLGRGNLNPGWGERGWRDRRIYLADHEELAEGHIGELPMEMKDVLEREGVRIESVEDLHRDDLGYKVIINGETYDIFDASIWEYSFGWGVAAKRALEIVNDLLSGAGSEERLYGIYGGNDGLVILLNSEIFDFLKSETVDVDPRWMPYSPEEMDEDGRVDR